MNITEFLALKVGAEISQGAHKYRIIANHAGIIVAQRTVSLHTGDDWMLVDPPAPPRPKTQDYVPPRPTLFDMHQQVLAAGYKFVRKHIGTGWRYQSPSGWYYPTVEKAWDTLPVLRDPTIPQRETLYSWSPTVEMMWDDLYAAGWKYDKFDSLEWTTPDGMRAGSTPTSWKLLQKLRGKR